REESTTRRRREQQRMSKLRDEHCRETLVCSEVLGQIDEVEAPGEIGLRIDCDVDVRMQRRLPQRVVRLDAVIVLIARGQVVTNLVARTGDDTIVQPRETVL